MGCFLTVFTPTYNRGYTLPRLYASLCAQTMRDFEWVIVDDGSTDNTHELVERFILEDKLIIKYFCKQNGGKHTAINYGVKKACGEWFFIVDSDDYLTDDALQLCRDRISAITHRQDVAGVVGLRGRPDRSAWSTWQHEGKENVERARKVPCLTVDAITYRYKMGLRGDRAEVVKTDIIAQYPFPEFDNEKFISEGYLWMSLAKDGYVFSWFDKVIYITEYLEDGLTKNIKKHYINSPKGRCCVDNLKVSCKTIPLKERLRASANYYRYGLCGGGSLYSLFKAANAKHFAILSIPVGVVMYLRTR